MILAYPFAISASGVSTYDQAAKSQLLLLLNTLPGTRLDDPNYGIDIFSFEQELLNDDVSPDRTMFVVHLSEKIARYIPDMVLTDVTFERGDNESDVHVNVYYKYKGGKDRIVWQPNTSLK
jgi:hypothetical protein